MLNSTNTINENVSLVIQIVKHAIARISTIVYPAIRAIHS